MAADPSTDADIEALVNSGALNLDPETEPEAEPNLPPATDGALPEEPSAEDVAQWKAYGKRMAAENQKYRERYQPVERVFSGLEPAEAETILGFVQAYASGNQTAAVSWLANNAAALADQWNLADKLEEAGLTRKQAQQAAAAVKTETNGAPEGQALTADQVQRMIQEEAARQQAQRDDWEGAQREALDAFKQIGVDGDSPYGALIRDTATRLLHTDRQYANASLTDLIKAGHAEVERTAREHFMARANAAKNGQGGGPAPNGTAIGKENLDPFTKDASKGRVAAVIAGLSGRAER